MYLAVGLMMMILASSSEGQINSAIVFTKQQTSTVMSPVSSSSPLPSTRSEKPRNGISFPKNTSAGRRNSFRLSLPLPPHERKPEQKETETHDSSSTRNLPLNFDLSSNNHSEYSSHISHNHGHHNPENINDTRSGHREYESDDREGHQDSYGSHRTHEDDDHSETMNHRNSFHHHHSGNDDDDSDDDHRNHPTTDISVDWSVTHSSTEPYLVGQTRRHEDSDVHHKEAKAKEDFVENNASSSVTLKQLTIAMGIGTLFFRDRLV